MSPAKINLTRSRTSSIVVKIIYSTKKRPPSVHVEGVSAETETAQRPADGQR